MIELGLFKPISLEKINLGSFHTPAEVIMGRINARGVVRWMGEPRGPYAADHCSPQDFQSLQPLGSKRLGSQMAAV
ncbi:hypothetical protein PABG_11455 [Paracoccidioides brasiliensis Pb03]|nr:hypothetical protein PABG_11455 [Paracoccidioides brasiliensis Pb03]